VQLGYPVAMFVGYLSILIEIWGFHDGTTKLLDVHTIHLDKMTLE